VLESQKKEFEKGKVQLVSVNLDEPHRAGVVSQFIAQQNFTFRTLLNKTNETNYGIDKDYHVLGTPVTYLVERGGTVFYSHYGPLGPEKLKALLEGVSAP
jgi:hypothetical protein